ncbi:dual specificity protein phosphatase 14 isoform X2 [Rattus norvegicus]|uniref:dual specificity protein phosphatase 14 isoform X2 n=1 Tax=Rattus norvegicus TaxID=10116 RepID=UPI0019174378|nr:dual specificity protein phosphatase 14 isoform X2 [Rattus norvegicus]
MGCGQQWEGGNRPRDLARTQASCGLPDGRLVGQTNLRSSCMLECWGLVDNSRSSCFSAIGRILRTLAQKLGRRTTPQRGAGVCEYVQEGGCSLGFLGGGRTPLLSGLAP